MKQNNSKVTIPNESSIYEYSFSEKTKSWTLWSEQFKNFEVDPKLTYSEIMIPTNDSQRNIFLMKFLLSNNYNCLFPGPTGTGKSLNAVTLLTARMGEEFQYISITFSAQTSAN
jgi:dynein heavy chain